MFPGPSIKKELLRIALLLVLIAALTAGAPFFAGVYVHYLFTLLQYLRCTVLNFLPFSLGDLLYLFLALYLLYRLYRMCKGFQRAQVWQALLKIIRLSLGIYLLLYLLWGVNYEQPKLARRLSLTGLDSISNASVLAFDRQLSDRLNRLQPFYQQATLADINKTAAATYKKRGEAVPTHVKPTLMGDGLAYWGIEGYFNPVSGEGQVNKYNPHFMQAFVVAHEMAHQTGIAAEDDANLMAYITCMESNDPGFQYSATLNLWLYTHRKARRIDSMQANEIKRSLNPVTLAQLDTLKQRQTRYHTFLDDWSGALFDAYLKLGKQKEGIGSYRNVVYSALCWERKHSQKQVQE